MERLPSLLRLPVKTRDRVFTFQQHLSRFCETRAAPSRTGVYSVHRGGVKPCYMFRRQWPVSRSSQLVIPQVRRLSTKQPDHVCKRATSEQGHLCEVCSQLDLAQILRDGAADEESQEGLGGELSEDFTMDESIQLGFLDEIGEREECPLCRLVTHLLDVSDLDPVRSGLPFKGENSGRIACGLRTLPAHRLDDFRRQDDAGMSTIYLGVVIQLDDNILKSRRCLVIDAKHTAPRRLSRYPDEPPRPCFYSGRRMNPDQVDFGLLRAWVRDCTEYHSYPRCRHKSMATPSALPGFRVVDVHSRTVVDAPPGSRYAALSYRWGPISYAKNMFRLKRSNLAGNESLVELPARLPNTIEDALTLVKELGERYLWIDALCIFDDDPQDKSNQISGMAEIYRNALFTVVAAYGEDTDAGLPGVRPGSRAGEQQYSEDVGGLRFTVSLPSLGEELYGYDVSPDEQDEMETLTPSSWISRAWTMQEGLLSARCLIFTASQVFWVCSAELCCESIAEPPKRQRFWLKPPKWVSTFSSPFIPAPNTALEELDLKDPVLYEFNTYSQLIQDYSQRQMTFQHDKLNAIDGILKTLSYRFSPRFFWGLPERLFDLALLWRVSTPHQGSLRNTGLFPSWSWASWSGGVSYGREAPTYFLTQDQHAEPLNEYFFETAEQTRKSIIQLAGDDNEDGSLFDCHVHSFSPFLHFEASTAMFKILSVNGSTWFRIGPHPASHNQLPEEVGYDIFIDNPLDVQRLHGTDCELVVLSRWFPDFSPRRTVYNVLCIEWKDGIAYRLGTGSIKAEIWNKANPVRKHIKLG